MGSYRKAKAVPNRDGALDRRRRTAGIIAIIGGVPNFLASAFLFISGVLGFGFLLYLLIALIFKDTGGDACAGLIVIILIVLVVIGLVVLIILLLLLMVLLIGISGQVIGGILAFKGKRFGLSVTLLVIGSVTSLISGLTMIIAALIVGTDTLPVLIMLALWGIYNIAAAVVSGICAAVILTCKDSFASRIIGSKDKKGSPKRAHGK
jgi:hypothetical protein